MTAGARDDEAAARGGDAQPEWPRWKRAVLACLANVALPLVWCNAAYYGFQTNYTTGVFHKAGFLRQYGEGVYRTRVAARWSLLKVHALLEAVGNPLPSLKPIGLERLDRHGDRLFYDALFIHNTLFQLVASWALYAAVRAGGGKARDALIAAVLGNAWMALTQFVVVPYDTLSWALLLIGAALAMRRPGWGTSAALVVAVAAGTLVRETALLVPAFYAAVQHRALRGHGDPKTTRLARVTLGAAALAGVAVWAGLKLSVAGAEVYQSNLLLYNVTHGFSVWGLVGLVTLVALLVSVAPSPRRSGGFVLLALPWLAAVVTVGNAWELRLWTPVWLLLGVLAFVPGERDGAAG